MARIKKIPAAFYQSGTGRHPVREWLKDLNAEDRKVIGADIATVEYGWPVGMPTCRPPDTGSADTTNVPNWAVSFVL